MKVNLLLICLVMITVVLANSMSLMAFHHNNRSTKPNLSLYDTESLRLQKIINAHPNNYEAVKKYINITGLNNPALISQFGRWMRKFPKSVSFPLAMGEAYSSREMPESRLYLLKALKIKPKMVTIWEMLGEDALQRGDDNFYQICLKKEHQLKPGNTEYLFDYAMSFEHIDSAKWHSSLFNFLKLFPKDNLGAVGLYCLANANTDTIEKTKLYERLKTNYPFVYTDFFQPAMSELFDLYLECSHPKALQLAKERHFKARITMINNLELADSLTTKNRFDDALNLINRTQINVDSLYKQYDELFLLKRCFILVKKEGVQAAYDRLLSGASKAPTVKKMNALYLYGSKLGKTNSTVIEDLKNQIAASARPADPFEAKLYDSNDSLSLNDCKGKAVLLTFWFPGCGPCREEFYYIEHVLKSSDRSDLEYIGVNALSEQDKYVPGFVAHSGVTFTPLHGNTALLNSYAVYGEPTNFIIGKDGRIMFSDFRISADNESTLALMLQLAL